MGKTLDDLSKQLNDLDKNIGNYVAKKIKPELEKSVQHAIDNFYGSYTPIMYNREENFKKVNKSVKVSGNKTMISCSADSGYMSNYPGFKEKTSDSGEQKLEASTAFEYFFMNGEHGHGNFLAGISEPPYMQVKKDILSGFHGEATNILESVISKYLK